jgi:23S rRNA (cytosine1962-C5)-methyltransferase
VEAVLERTDRSGRRRAAGTPSCRVLSGSWSEGPVDVHERPGGSRSTGRPWAFRVDVAGGQKTGFYLDQRDSRQLVASVAEGRRVLDLFAYTGGFSVAAASANASEVTTVDSSRPALDLAAVNLAANGLPPGRLVVADVFRDLRARRDEGERYDLVVVDPPKLASSQAEVARATRAYKDLNWLACRLLATDGVLVTFSCSAAVGAELFQKVVFGAALDAGVDLQLVGRLGQPADHPVLLSVPETEYLTGLVCRAV